MIHLHHPGLLSPINESKRVTDFSLTFMQMPGHIDFSLPCKHQSFLERANEKAGKGLTTEMRLKNKKKL